MDWTDWTPQMRANLMFVKNGDQVLLIRKKRGLGAGKINGPGGKIEPGESARDGAIRETQEEVGITALDPVAMGELHFQFTDGLGIQIPDLLLDGARYVLWIAMVFLVVGGIWGSQ